MIVPALMLALAALLFGLTWRRERARVARTRNARASGQAHPGADAGAARAEDVLVSSEDGGIGR